MEVEASAGPHRPMSTLRPQGSLPLTTANPSYAEIIADAQLNRSTCCFVLCCCVQAALCFQDALHLLQSSRPFLAQLNP